MQNKDPKFIVIDEFIGQASMLVFCNQLILDYILAFIGFRILDILKPFLNYFDKIKNLWCFVGRLSGWINYKYFFYLL